MKKYLSFSLIVWLFSLTTGCQVNFGTLNSNTTPESTASATLSPSTPTVTFTPTEVPVEAMTTQQLLEKYIASDAKIDISSLSNNQRRDFSEALTKYKNEQRGVNPVVYNEEAYIDPDSYKMYRINDSKSRQEQTIQMFLPVSQDIEGNLLVKFNNEWITIKDSKNIDWNLIVTDKNDPRINFPETEYGYDGLPYIQWVLSRNEEPDNYKSKRVLIPIVLLDKNFGGVFLEGRYPRIFTTLRVVTIETDIAGNPLFARISIAIWSRFNLFEEGSNIYLFDDVILQNDNYESYLQNPMNKKLIAFWETLEENQVYYMGFNQNQKDPFENGIFAHLGGWEGFAPIDESGKILSRQIKNDCPVSELVGQKGQIVKVWISRPVFGIIP